MTGMETVIALRRQGFKPASVSVDLVSDIGKYDVEQFSFDERSGVVNINIAESESLNGIDFRPLVGLMVFIYDNAGNESRHRRCCALIAKAGACHMVMPVWKGDALTVHQRWAGDPARVESTSI